MNETKRIETLDGTIHSASWMRRKSHGHLTGTMADLVLVTKCGSAATGNSTTSAVNCPACLGR